MKYIERLNSKKGIEQGARRAAARKMWLLLGRAIACAALMATATTASALESHKRSPRIQLALLLDTSNSMDGLINQAKSQLWRVVNEFVNARQGESPPVLEVALYEYGNSGLNAESHWVRQVVPLTTDLDAVSDRLFNLRTNGGEEYCGVAGRCALEGLRWSTVAQDLKTVIIAGNEAFDQGPEDYRETCRLATEKGVLLNTIFCGARKEGVSTFWQDGASLGGGSFFHIDHTREVQDIKTPQDAEIEKLGVRLNSTYIPYGRHGAAGASNQRRQDGNALSVNSTSNVSRQLFKGSALYDNSFWDLLDATEKGTVHVEQLPKEHLPENMRDMSSAERAAFLKNKREERTAIQKQLAALRGARETFIASLPNHSAENSLDTAMIEAVHAMAEAKGFRFE
jgi:hypothetical protein